MTLWARTIAGDIIELPFSPSELCVPCGWRPVYRFLHTTLPFAKEAALHQLRLLHEGSMELSGVKEGDVLDLVITDKMAEQWISEYTISAPPNTTPPLYRFHHSTMSWLDGRWGDPYETPEICYRPPITIHVIMRESVKDSMYVYQINPEFFKERYSSSSRPLEQEWYPTLRDALCAIQKRKRHGEEMTDKTIEHLVHLWELYHGSNEHLIRQGRYYE